MKVYVFQSTGPVELAEDQLDEPSSGPRIGWDAAPPATGYWKTGDRIYNSVGAGSWVCTIEGLDGGADWVADNGVPVVPLSEVVGLVILDGAGNVVGLAGNVASCTLNGGGSYILTFNTAYATLNDYVVTGVQETGGGAPTAVFGTTGKETGRCFPASAVNGTFTTVACTLFLHRIWPVLGN